MTQKNETILRDYDRDLLKASLVSLFWAVISARKKRGRYTLQNVADAVGKNKSVVSRWFSSPPNWQLETVADLASALEIDIEFRARDRATGQVFTPSGPIMSSTALPSSRGGVEHFTPEPSPKSTAPTGQFVRIAV